MKRRIDDEQRRDKVRMVRKFIYEQGRPVTSVHVKRWLQSESLVPTEVRLVRIEVSVEMN